MLILALESSAQSASVALCENEKLICEVYANTGLTHSVTLLPQVKSVLDFAGKKIEDIDLLALSNGPGSFTGLRIGAATIKGLCSDEKKCIGVSTLEAMAYSHLDFDGMVCALMDARCNQFYNALFSGKQRLCEDRALLSEELFGDLEKTDGKILLVGDGAQLCLEKLSQANSPLLERVILCPENSRFQHASGVCLCALEKMRNGQEAVCAENLNLSYLRLPQAERELKKKEKKL